MVLIVTIVLSLLLSPPASATPKNHKKTKAHKAGKFFKPVPPSYKTKISRAKELCGRAASRERKGDSAGALRDYSDCLELDKTNGKAYHRRGRLRLKAGKVALAIDDFYKAIALDLNFAEAYADRARAYEKQGDLGFAVEDYKRACHLGVQDACPKAQELAAAKRKPKIKSVKPSRRAPAAIP